MSESKLPEMIEGAKGGGYTPVQDPDSLRSTAKGRVVDLIAEGEIEGLINGAKSIYFDDTPLMADDGSYNFANVSYDIRYGLPQQDPLTGFDSVETEVSAGREITVDTTGGKPGPYEFTLTETDLDAVRVTIRVPTLVEQTDKGDVLKTSVKMKIEVKAGTGAYSTVIQDVIYGKTTAGYERSYRINLPKPAANWTIRVTRQTPDSTTEKLQNKTYVSTYTKIIDAKLIYPDSAVVGVSLDAGSFNGSIPVRGYHVRGRKIQVPANYNPTTRTYATTGTGTTNGYWNGTFKTVYSNNPAWVLYDILDNDRFGLGQFIDASQIDKYSLYAIAQYCDQMVDDGKGGTEPRFALNCSISDRVEAYNLVQSIASNFRAMSYWAVGAITAIQDSPKDPVQLVTPANVIGGEFNYQSTGLKDRHTVALVTWNDPSDMYRVAVEAVENAEGIKRYGYRPVDVYAFGCTSRGQAHRLGRWLLETEYSEKEAISYTASIDHIGARPGDIITVADPTKSGTRAGGRIAGGTTTSVILDSEITVASGDYLCLTRDDGSLMTVAVTPNATASATVTLAAALPETPKVGNIWLLYGGAVTQRMYRILGISEREDNLFEVQGVAYDPNKFTRVEQNLAFDPIIRDNTFQTRVAPPSNLSILEGVYFVNNQVRSRLLLSWAAPDSYASGYEVRSTSPSGAVSQWSFVENTYFEVPDAELGAYVFEVRSVGVDNSRSQAVTLSYTVLGKAAPPGKPTGLTTTVGIRTATLNWTNPTDVDLAYIEVWSSLTNNVATATSIGSVLGTTFTHAGLTAGATYYYWVRAVDTSGNVGDWNATLGVAAVPTSETITTTTPANITGLSVTGSIFLLPDGSPQVKLVATWSAAANAAYYDIEIREGAGNYVSFQTSTLRYEWVGRPATAYSVRVRGVSQFGVFSTGYSDVFTYAGAADSTPPAVPSALTITSSLRAAFLRWTNPADSDLSSVEIWSNTVNNSATATRVGTVNAEPSKPSGFTHSGLTTGTTYYYWLKAVDTSGNISGFSTGATAGTAVTIGSVADGDIAAGTINADKLVVGSITGDRFDTGTSLPGTITVGSTGVSIGTVETRAGNGQTAFSGTAKYRTAGAPTAVPAPTGITITENSNGTRNIRLDWSAYTQGANQADFLMLFWRKGATAPTVNDAAHTFNVNTAAASYFIMEGVSPADVFSFGIAAARRTENGLEIGAIQSPASTPQWVNVSTATPNYTANVGGTSAATVVSNALAGATAATNFNANNDRNATTPTAPTLPIGGNAVDHVVNTDGSVDISFEWLYMTSAVATAANNIDGFLIYVRSSTASTAYTFGTTPAEETIYDVPSDRRAMFLPGVPADKYYTIGVAAYRRVDSDIDATGLKMSAVVKSAVAGENPYQPASSVAFDGDITGTVSGTAAATVVSNAALGAQNPTTRINAGSTTIDPGKVLISGTTTLSSWRNGTDNTKIDGGNIAANTISANLVSIGLRGLDIVGLEFEAQKTGANILSWSAGTISYIDDAGVPATAAITAGTTTWVNPQTRYVYWIKGATTLSTTATQTTAYGDDRVVLATYRGGIDLVVTYGRTIIDGSQITTGTVNANTLKSGTAITNTLYVGATNRIVLDGVNNEIYQLPATGTTKIFQSTAAGVTLRKADGTVILDTSGGVNAAALGLGSLAYENSVAYTSVTGRPTNLAGINATEGSKLGGIQAGATVGAVIGTNLSGQMTSGNISTFIADAAISSAQIGSLVVGKLSGDVSKFVQAAYRSSSSAGIAFTTTAVEILKATIPQSDHPLGHTPTCNASIRLSTTQGLLYTLAIQMAEIGIGATADTLALSATAVTPAGSYGVYTWSATMTFSGQPDVAVGDRISQSTFMMDVTSVSYDSAANTTRVNVINGTPATGACTRYRGGLPAGVTGNYFTIGSAATVAYGTSETIAVVGSYTQPVNYPVSVRVVVNSSSATSSSVLEATAIMIGIR